MRWINRIWHLWDTTVGRITTIVGGLGLIFTSIALIIKAFFLPDQVDCIRSDLALSEFDKCVFDNREIYDKEFFRSEWIGKRVTWEAKFSSMLPADASGFRDTPEPDNEVWVFLAPWGPQNVTSRHLIECRHDFEVTREARDYWDSIRRFAENEKVIFTGKISNLRRGNLSLDECLVLKVVSD